MNRTTTRKAPAVKAPAESGLTLELAEEAIAKLPSNVQRAADAAMVPPMPTVKFESPAPAPAPTVEPFRNDNRAYKHGERVIAWRPSKVARNHRPVPMAATVTLPGVALDSAAHADRVAHPVSGTFVPLVFDDAPAKLERVHFTTVRPA